MPGAEPAPGPPGLIARLASRDPHHLAFARGLRAILVGPPLFAIGLGVFHDDLFALTAIFGGTSAVLFADFGGETRPRTEAYLALALAGAGLLAAGTLVSETVAAAIPLTFFVVGVIRFLGNLGQRWSAAMSPAILAFVLGALVPGSASDIPPRVIGWSVSVGLAAVVAALVLPNRTRLEVERVAATAAEGIAAAFSAVMTTDSDAGRAAVVGDLHRIREALHEAMLTPSRPAGVGADDMARRLVLDGLARMSRLLEAELDRPPSGYAPDLHGLVDVSTDLLRAAARVLRGESATTALRPVLHDREAHRTAILERHVAAIARGEPADAVLDAVDHGFVVRACAWHADGVACNVAFLGGDHELARAGALEVRVPDPTTHGARERFGRLLGEHRVPSSPWFRDAVRAGLALALSVGVAFALDVEHGFWVALGTLSVLRSSALATSSSAVSAAVGTAAGFGASSLVFVALGFDDALLWILLVVAFFLAGYLPRVGGLAAGQAAFTVAVIALFELVEPDGWHVGLVRLEDVAIGASVSALVALVFWPRRLEPLVAELVARLSTMVGGLLVRTLSAPVDAAWQSARADATVAEGRTRAALVELLAQLAERPETVSPWIVRLSVATHTRSACAAIAVIDQHLLTGTGAGATRWSDELGAALADAGRVVADGLAPGRGPAVPPCAARLRARTRDVAETALGRADGAGAVARAVVVGAGLGARDRGAGRRPALINRAVRGSSSRVGSAGGRRPRRGDARNRAGSRPRRDR